MKRWIRWASLLYPAQWRGRYGKEFDALLDDAGLGWRDLADVVRGAAIMQMTTWMNQWKMLTLTALAGAILACGIAFAMHDQYLCHASLLLQSNQTESPAVLARRFQDVYLRVLSRDNLIALINSENLYSKERESYPIEDIASQTMGKKIHIVPVAAGLHDMGLRVSFEYPDRLQARNVIVLLVSQMTALLEPRRPGDPPQDGIVRILEQPLVPNTPIYPNRLAILLTGLFGGLLAGVLAVRPWRPTSS